jgi:deazaflavin-dependent oxidoreductase (nitroreductase family)
MPSRLFLPVIQLTTTGHRTGLPRHTPICAHHATADGTWLIVASNFGRPHHPAWSTNLLHHPHAAIAHGGPAQPVTARLLTSHEQAEHRARILAALPVFDSYAARARRDLRIFLLTPTPPS